MYFNFLPKIDGGHFKDLEMGRRKLSQKQTARGLHLLMLKEKNGSSGKFLNWLCHN
jgi:hypothetical protein